MGFQNSNLLLVLLFQYIIIIVYLANIKFAVAKLTQGIVYRMKLLKQALLIITIMTDAV